MKTLFMASLIVLSCAFSTGCDEIVLEFIGKIIASDRHKKRIEKEEAEEAEFARIKKEILDTGLPDLQRETFASNENGGEKRQQEIAEAINLPISRTNSIGMQFNLIPHCLCRYSTVSYPRIITSSYAHKLPKEVISEYFALQEADKLITSVYNNRIQFIITQPFYIGTHEVTVGDFRQFTKATGYQTDAQRGKVKSFGWVKEKRLFSNSQNTPFDWSSTGFEQNAKHPVVNLTLNDIHSFIEWLSKKDGVDYQLPTDAQWEYACRGGLDGDFNSGLSFHNHQSSKTYMNVIDKLAIENWGNTSKMLPIKASEELGVTLKLLNCDNEFLNNTISHRWTRKLNDGYVFTAPVGKHKPNGYGLFDMHGNVSEICRDGYERKRDKQYECNPVNVVKGNQYSLHGGSWCSLPFRAQVGFRSPTDGNLALPTRGFRLVYSVPPSSYKQKKNEGGNDLEKHHDVPEGSSGTEATNEVKPSETPSLEGEDKQ